MATAREAIVRALVDGVLTDLMIKTGVSNVYLDDGTKLSAKLAEVIAALNEKATSEALTSGLSGKANTSHTHAQGDITGLSSALSSRPTTSQMEQAISDAISDLIGGAPGTYDTLKEIADYISGNETAMTALNGAIGKKVDKETGKGLSANDFTNAMKSAVEGMGALASKNSVSENDLDAALKEKVNAASEGNHSHANKTVLDGITAQKVVEWNGKGKVYVQPAEPSGLTASDLWLQLT